MVYEIKIVVNAKKRTYELMAEQMPKDLRESLEKLLEDSGDCFVKDFAVRMTIDEEAMRCEGYFEGNDYKYKHNFKNLNAGSIFVELHRIASANNCVGWDVVTVCRDESKHGVAELVTFVISIKKVCREEILGRQPRFMDLLALEAQEVTGVRGIINQKEAVVIEVEEPHKFDLLRFVEDFLFANCETLDPYQVMDIQVEESAYREEIKQYMETCNDRLVDEMFAELEKRLEETEKAQAEEKRQKEQLRAKLQEEGAGTDKSSFDYPVKFSPAMISYIEELRRVTKTLYEIDGLSQFFTKSLLVSMDDGWGYSSFLKTIRDELLRFYKVSAKDISITETSWKNSDGLSPWEGQPDAIKRVAEGMKINGKFSIISYDMTPWLTELENPALLNYIRRIGQYAENVICVFRFPYMESKALRRAESQLSNVLSLRTIVVPPVSLENMVAYFKNRLRTAGFVEKSDCDELLEQWICQEKNEGNFYGYKTLDKMASELIYHKALHGDKSKVVTFIHPEDIRPMLTEQLEAEDAYQLLDELIGIAQVKTKVREIVAQIKLQKRLEEQGKAVDKPSIHMMFLGNPGTGKTTVARIIGRILRQEGILRKGQFLERQGGDFVERYIGHSAAKVQACCREAYGNVLFIDEAYGMSVDGARGNTTDEILPVLISEMENHRDDMCIIFAGYTEEMKEFLKQNSGLESRISHSIEFPNYTKEELVQIFFRMVEGKFEYEEALKETVIEYISNIPEECFQTREFSNGRFVRNLYEHLWGKAAYRMSLSGETEVVLRREDMIGVMEEEDMDSLIAEKNTRKIGFLS